MKKHAPTAKVSRPKPFWEGDDDGPARRTEEVTRPPKLPTLPGLTIGGLLGEGGSATVYSATDERGRRFALKVAKPTVEGAEVQREAKLMSSLRHPSIPRVHRHGQLASGEAYLLMERIDGVPLDELFAERSRPAPWRTTRRQLLELLDALAAMHEAGLLHRDVKPANVLVRDGEPSLVLIDFGISKKLVRGGVAPTSAHAVRGTLEYMSPEQLSGQRLDEKSDVFSAGLLAFEGATGRLPWASALSLGERLRAMRTEPVERPALVPEADFGVLRRLLALDPADRPAAGEAMSLFPRRAPTARR